VSLLAEWVEKAEGDYKSAVALQRRRTEPLLDTVCYHCQQCVEKYLKAYLMAQGSTGYCTALDVSLSGGAARRWEAL
jgi:HEPN domain-containing protein